MRFAPCLLLSIAAVACLPASAQSAARAFGAERLPYSQRDDVQRFAEALAARRPDLDLAWVREQLGQARYVAAATQLIMPPSTPTAKNWAAYRARFVERERIAAGAAFWRANQAWLTMAEARWGVPAEIVVGIVGVETFYGRIMGNFRTIDALATLSFDFPSGRSDRSPFFREQLEELLVWSRREGSDPLAVRGSFAGAVGLPQFMPGSIIRYAVDFDGDGHIEFMKPAQGADTIGSIARYLAAFGWQPGLPTHYRVTPPAALLDRAVLLVPDIVPSFSAAQLLERGAELSVEGREHAGLLALVELHNGGAAPSYVAGTSNFYALTRYNWSSYYALAVIDLGSEIAKVVASTPAAASPPRAASPLGDPGPWRLMARHGACDELDTLRVKVPNLADVGDPQSLVRQMRDRGHEASANVFPGTEGRAVAVKVPALELDLVFATRHLCEKTSGN